MESVLEMSAHAYYLVTGDSRLEEIIAIVFC